MSSYKLYYKSSEIEFNIGFFSKKEDAEHWKEFLVFCIQEFPFETMFIAPVTLQSYIVLAVL